MIFFSIFCDENIYKFLVVLGIIKVIGVDGGNWFYEGGIRFVLIECGYLKKKRVKVLYDYNFNI